MEQGVTLIGETRTNNWSDYGGMDVYTHQILGSSAPHDDFYTNAQVVAAYKNYIKTFVGRYVNEPTIMAWELGKMVQRVYIFEMLS
jgi:endo-1,4-beta-mannosidase